LNVQDDILQTDGALRLPAVLADGLTADPAAVTDQDTFNKPIAKVARFHLRVWAAVQAQATDPWPRGSAAARVGRRPVRGVVLSQLRGDA
jgi:hypothetical protein